MDLHEKQYKTNVSLPQRLQTINFDETELKNVIVNTQKSFYDLKIAELNKRIQRLEERNKELENNLEDTNFFIKTLQEEETQEISKLKSQIASYIKRIEEYKLQLITLEKIRIDDKFTHTARVINKDKKYENTRLILTSQIKLLNAKINILEDYKLTQYVLEKKLDMRNQLLINEKEQIIENLCNIERNFRIDREKFKKKLYNRLLDLANVFQLEVSKHVPRSISNLRSETIALTNQLSMIMDSTTSKRQTYVLHTNAVKEYERKIKDIHLSIIRPIVISKLEKSIITMLHNIHKKANVNLSKLIKFNYFTEEQYIMNKDNAKILARKCETRVKHVEILLYREKAKLAIAENQKQRISERIQEHLEILYDVTYVLKNLKIQP